MRPCLVPKAFLAAVVVLASVACSEAPTRPSTSDPNGPSDAGAARILGWPFVQPSPGGPPVLVGAGDIAACDTRYKDEETAALLDDIPGTVMAVGDEAYPNGSIADFACYHESWGRHKDRTRPATGNHEYISGGTGYFTYFGLVSNPPLGYYSYNLGSWHVIVLNSTPQVYMCYPPELMEAPEEGEDSDWWRALWPTPQLDVPPTSPALGRACAGDAPQQAWLIADLLKHRRFRCTLVYFHHPRFSSGQHGNHYQMQRIWDILYHFRADVVVSGHDHLYERFAPQDPEGNLDLKRGIRQFTVGTGGAPLYGFDEIQPNSEVRNNTTHGVIKLTLGDRRYDWQFVPVAGQSFTDSGSGDCH